MKKKVLSLIVAIVMVLTMLPVMGLATNTPPAVTINSITSADGKVMLSWNAAAGVDGYRVHRKTGSGKWTTVVASTKSTSYTDTNVTVGTTYTYAIRSYIGDTYSTGYNETAKSIKVVSGSAAEPKPVTISSITSANGKVTLSWNAVPGVDGYRVHRKTGSGKWTTVVASTKSTSYTDTNVTVGTTYTYAIRSYIGDT
ncbi:MAG: hypothetical protein IKD89_04670, partial [Clostridia bacterium]|nr:hypothetical protein [Clostridia bacterium]